MSVSRMRMFAGPNGSGKSRLRALVEEVKPDILGHFVNADEIEAGIRARGYFSPQEFLKDPDLSDLLSSLGDSSFLRSVGLDSSVQSLWIGDGVLHFDKVQVNSYFASVLADYVRRELLRDRQLFSFETVMSAPDKVQFLREARAQGCRTYLYYVGHNRSRSQC